MLDANKPQVQEVSLLALHPADWNPRTIKDGRFQNLCASIQADPDFLWRRPVLAQADGTIYAGNMRYYAAQHLGMETIPAIIEDVPDQLARERALRDNAQGGEWESNELALLLDRLREDGSDLSIVGFDERELQRLLYSMDKSLGLADPDDVPALPEEPTAKSGDLYQLGPHRLLCGDSTSEHPTSKPVALVEAMVKNSSRSGEIVLDAFIGSGSSLIACERLGRRCFGIELDPRYVDVAVRRWEMFTGRKAEKTS